NGEPLRVLSGVPAAFVHVRDASRALLGAANLQIREPFRILNCAPEVLYVSDIAAQVRALAAARGLNVRIQSEAATRGGTFHVRSTLDSAGLAARESMAASLPEVLDHFLCADHGR